MNRSPSSFSLDPTRALPTSGTVAAAVSGVYRIPAGRAARFVAERPVVLMVWSGRLWLTRSGEPTDHFPAPGQSLTFGAGEEFVVEADDAAGVSFSIVAVSPRELAAGAPAGTLEPTRPAASGLAEDAGSAQGPGVGAMPPAQAPSLRARLVRWWRARRALRMMAALGELSDHQLRDIGIEGAAATALWLRREHQSAVEHARARFDTLW